MSLSLLTLRQQCIKLGSSCFKLQNNGSSISLPINCFRANSTHIKQLCESRRARIVHLRFVNNKPNGKQHHQHSLLKKESKKFDPLSKDATNLYEKIEIATKEAQNTNSAKVQKQATTLFQRFKEMASKYWYVLFPVHIATSAVWFGGLYYVASSGFDVPGLLRKISTPEWVMEKVTKSSAGYVALAYAMYKIITPIRYTVTLAGTTLMIRILVKRGLIRPIQIPSRRELKKRMQDKFRDSGKK